MITITILSVIYLTIGIIFLWYILVTSPGGWRNWTWGVLKQDFSMVLGLVSWWPIWLTILILKEFWAYLPDRCEMPGCCRRGLRGNEQIIGGKRVCDYCHAKRYP